MPVILQKFFVVISFHHQRLHLSQSFSDQFRDVTEVGNITEAACARLKHESDWVHGVVRHGERLHRDIADRKLNACRDQSPIPTSLRQTIGPKRLGGESIAINRQIEFVAENFKTTDVIGVFMCEKNAIELLGRDAALFQTQNDLPRAQPSINENLAMVGGD